MMKPRTPEELAARFSDYVEQNPLKVPSIDWGVVQEISELAEAGEEKKAVDLIGDALSSDDKA